MLYCNDTAETISLEGSWNFSLDGSPQAAIQVPGCWEAQGYSRYTEGPARYSLTVQIPGRWAGKHIQLEFDAVSYACTVWCNGIEVGQHLGLWTPFAIDLTRAARVGADNRIELVVYKPGERYPMRSSLAGFLPDVATTFGGIWQPVRLRGLSYGLADPFVQSHYASQSISVRCAAETFGAHPALPEWSVQVEHRGEMAAHMRIPFIPGEPLDVSIPLETVACWHPDHPELYDVRVSLCESGRPVAEFTRRVGFRRLSTDGVQLLLNDQPFQVRGILSWGWDPDRIAPCYSAAQAREEMRKARSLGFNLIKLCLFVPNAQYFDAAAEAGVLLWEELPLWLPEVNQTLREQAPIEYAELAQRLTHQPALVLWSLGCELNQAVDAQLLEQLNAAVRGCVQDGLLCDNSGSGESYGGYDLDFADFTDYHPYYDLHYFEPLLDNWRRDWQTPRPWIFGEFCDSDTFRDLNQILAAHGGRRPWWLTRENPVTTWRTESKAMLEWEARLARANPGFDLAAIQSTSYRQSYTIRKYTLEALHRRRGIGGYVITGWRDTPISTSGVWDDFDRPKWSAEEFQRINDDVVLCLDVARRRQWRHGGDRPDRLDVYNHWAGSQAHWPVIVQNSGSAFPAGGQLEWSLSGPRGEVIAAGAGPVDDPIPAGAPLQIGVIQCMLPDVAAAQKFTLDVCYQNQERQKRNRWPIWVYPRLAPPPAGLALVDPQGLLADCGEWLAPVPRLTGPPDPERYPVLISTVLEDRLWAYLEAGGRVLLLQQGENPLPVRRCPFWRESINLFSDHPLWHAFPQEGHTDLQFFGLASDLAFDTPRLVAQHPRLAQMQPVMRRLDAREFHISEYLLEAKIGQGKLLACALRLQGGLGNQPFGWQRNVAGAALLQSMLGYLFSA